MTGKIIKGIAGFYYVHDGKEKIYQCRAKGVFRSRNIKPLVGDDVEFTPLDGEEGTISQILPRKNQLIRPAAANVDQAMVLFAVADPEPNLNLLDRFLVAMEAQGLPAIVCFNKIDLGREEAAEKYRDIYRKAGYRVRFLSASQGKGIESLKELLQGKTTVLAGPSGVGKSSWTNLIQPEAGMETGRISQKIQRGRHTTRHTQLFCVEEDTYLMDTPGFSSLYLENMAPENLKHYFPEFAPYEGQCRFLGCVHVGETVCKVKEAVEAGVLSRSRYENYLLLYQELKEKERRKY